MQWNFDDDRPIWIQLTEQLTQGIVTGVFASGSRLPTVRELATQAGVNPNTAQRALSQLEAEGLAIGERGAPKMVTTDAGRIAHVRDCAAQALAQGYLASMAQLGYANVMAIAYLNQELTMEAAPALGETAPTDAEGGE